MKQRGVTGGQRKVVQQLLDQGLDVLRRDERVDEVKRTSPDGDIGILRVRRCVCKRRKAGKRGKKGKTGR
jgi:hypothetical protein